MAITLSPETQELIEARMKELGFASSDQFLQTVVVQYAPNDAFDYDDLDADTRAAIECADLQPDIPSEEAELRIFKRPVQK